MSLTEEESSSFTGDDMAKLRQIVESRVEKPYNHTRESEQLPFIRRKRRMCREVLWGYTRFAGLEMCARFADRGDFFFVQGVDQFRNQIIFDIR